MTTKIAQIVSGRMHGQESLSLLQRFELTHAPFSNLRWLMGKLRRPPIPGSARALSMLVHMRSKDPGFMVPAIRRLAESGKIPAARISSIRDICRKGNSSLIL